MKSVLAVVVVVAAVVVAAEPKPQVATEPDVDTTTLDATTAQEEKATATVKVVETP